MVAPRGKGIYARDPGYYPDGDPCQYAKDLGCQFVALHDAASSDDLFKHGMDLGLEVFIWQGPAAWLPNSWERTLDSHARRANALGLPGMICDVEHAKSWRGHDAELGKLIDGIANAAATFFSVGFTSFPTWPWMRDVAAAGAPLGLWGSPQLYGVLEPAAGDMLVKRADRWKDAFGPHQVTPSLAAWSRTPEEQADYLQWFRDERGGILWQSVTHSGAILPRVGTPGWDALKDWNVDYPGFRARTFFHVVAERITHPTRLRRT